MEKITEVTTEEVETMLQEGKDITLIDVREDEEVALGMIEEAIHIPLAEIPEKVSSLNKEDEYILICRSGRRSHQASVYMKENGFNVSNMAGGMLKWQGEVISK